MYSLILVYAFHWGLVTYVLLSRPREIREHFNFFAKKRSGALNCTKGVGFREKLVLLSSISGGGGCYRCCCCCFYCSCIRGTDMNARRVAQDGAEKMQFTVMRNEFWPKWRLFKRELTRRLLLAVLIAGNIVFHVNSLFSQFSARTYRAATRSTRLNVISTFDHTPICKLMLFRQLLLSKVPSDQRIRYIVIDVIRLKMILLSSTRTCILLCYKICNKMQKKLL